MTLDVDPYRLMRERLTEGVRVTVAYAGLLKGYSTLADTMRDPSLVALAQDFLSEAIATIEPQRGVNLVGYVVNILQDLQRQDVREDLTLIVQNGSDALTPRLLDTARSALRAGSSADSIATGVIGWMQYVRRQTALELVIIDPHANRLAKIARTCTGAAQEDVAAFLSLVDIFPEDLRQDQRFVGLITFAYAAAELGLAVYHKPQ